MTPTLWILLLWLGFGASHIGLASHRLRPKLVARLGEGPYAALYSLVALAFFVPLVWVYMTHRHEGGWLWLVALGPTTRGAIYAGMTIAWILIVAGAIDPSPVAGGSTEPRSVQHLTRHPVFMGVGLVGLLHLVASTAATDLAFFAGLPLFALLGCWHQDRRKLATGDADVARFHAATPFLPFSGRATWRGVREIPVAALVGGVAVTVALRLLHHVLFW